METPCNEIQLHLTDFIIITMTSGVGLFMIGYLCTKTIYNHLKVLNSIISLRQNNIQVVNAVHILD